MEVERHERIFYLNYLRDGMTVFDAGANVGELTLLFSRFVGPAGSVHAFEAARGVFERLKIVCEATGKRNITPNHLALADKSGFIRLHVYDEPLACLNSQAVRPLKNYGLDFDPVGIEDTPATTIDKYCDENNIERIDLLKIDVEGAEFQVMCGALGMLQSKRIRCLTFEFGQTTFDMGNTSRDIEKFLREANYQIRNIVAGDPVFPGRESVETAKYSMHVAVPEF